MNEKKTCSFCNTQQATTFALDSMKCEDECLKEKSTKCFPSEDTSPVSSSMGELNVNGIQISSTTFDSQIEFLEVVSKKLACKKVKIMTKRRRHRRRNFYRRR
ncbi:Hypothetical predicted protein [Mytilus galloprovincialis]|nr:Hypothetical predicted protein [Mytilus galloprovincialis]